MTVYLIRNKLDGREYVGATTQRPRRRFWGHLYATKRGGKYVTPLGTDLIRQGIDSFEIQELEKCFSVEALYARERIWINLLNSYSPRGYNVREGGLDGRQAQATKDKISAYRQSHKTLVTQAQLDGLKKAWEVNKTRPLTEKQLDNLRRGREIRKGMKPTPAQLAGLAIRWNRSLVRPRKLAK